MFVDYCKQCVYLATLCFKAWNSLSHNIVEHSQWGWAEEGGGEGQSLTIRLTKRLLKSCARHRLNKSLDPQCPTTTSLSRSRYYRCLPKFAGNIYGNSLLCWLKTTGDFVRQYYWQNIGLQIHWKMFEYTIFWPALIYFIFSCVHEACTVQQLSQWYILDHVLHIRTFWHSNLPELISPEDFRRP